MGIIKYKDVSYAVSQEIKLLNPYLEVKKVLLAGYVNVFDGYVVLAGGVYEYKPSVVNNPLEKLGEQYTFVNCPLIIRALPENYYKDLDKRGDEK